MTCTAVTTLTGCDPTEAAASGETVADALATVTDQQRPSVIAELRTIGTLDAGVVWLRQVVDTINRCEPGPDPTEERVLRCTARFTDAMLLARAAYHDAFIDLLPNGDVILNALESPEQMRTMMGTFHDVRLAFHEVHTYASDGEAMLAEELRRAGVDEARAHAEASAYATSARLDVQLDLCNLERQSHDALHEKLTFLLDNWGVWEVSDIDPDFLWAEDHIFQEFDRLDGRIAAVSFQRASCVDRLFARAAPAPPRARRRGPFGR